MKMKIKLMALVAGLLSILPTTSAWANTDTYYYAKATAAVSSTGGGKVYASSTSVTSPDSQCTGTTSMSDVGKSAANTQSVTLYRYAKANEGFEFKGWSTADNADISTISDTSTSVTVAPSATSESDANNYTYYAYFAKLKLAAFGIAFETSDAGTYTVDGVAPANKMGLTEATSVKLASSDPNFLNWKVNGAAINDNPYTATCIADTTISAEFLTADQVAEATTFDELTAALANDGKKKVVIPSGMELIVEKGATLTVPTGKQLVVEGTLAVIGTVNNSGVIFGNGKFMKISKIISQGEIQTLYMANGEECPKITEAHHSGIWPKYRKTTVEANTPSVTGAAVGCATTGWGVYFNGKVTSISKQSPVAVKVNLNTDNAVNDITAVVENGDVDSINAQGAYVLFDNCSIKGPPRGTSGDDAKRLNFNGTVDCAGKKVTFGLARTYSDFAPIILNGTIDFQPTTDFQNAAVLAFNCSSVTVKNIKGTGGKQYFYDCGTPSSQVNTKVTFDGNLWNPARNISLYQAPAYISAYSPYNAEISDPTDISVTNATDWLYAPLSTAKAITAGSPKVTIKMNHAFAIVKYTLVNDGYTGPGKLTKAEIKSNGYGTAASLNSTTGKLNNITGLDVATVAEYTSGKFVANSGDKQSDMFMVVPVVGNEEQITFTLTVDGQKYVSTMKIALNQGMIYEFPLKITDTGIDFNGGGEGGEGGEGDGTVIIMPWTTENVNSSNLNAAN